MTDLHPEMNNIGNETVDYILRTQSVWHRSTFRDKISKRINELDEAWSVGSEHALLEASIESRRLIDLAFAEEFIHENKAYRIQVDQTKKEYWLVPNPKSAKYFKTSLPILTVSEMINLLKSPPDPKTFSLLLITKKELKARFESPYWFRNPSK